MFQNILVQNGLSSNEAKLYIAALEAGETTMSGLAKKANLKRSTVYSLVEELQEKGVVSSVKKKGILYVSALSPRLLIERFQSSTDMAKNILPQLMDLAYSSPTKPRIRFYEGVEGINEILFDAVSAKEDYIGFTDYEHMPEEMYSFIQSKIVPERKKHGIVLKLIVPRNKVNLQTIKEYVRQVEHRVIDFPSRKNHIEILIYGKSKVGFMSYAGTERFGVVIDSEGIYATLHDLFMVIWNQAN